LIASVVLAFAAAARRRDLPAVHRPGRDRRARLAVDPHWRRESLRARLEPAIEQVAAGRIALEKDQVNDAPVIDHLLRLDAALGGREHPHITGACPPSPPARATGRRNAQAPRAVKIIRRGARPTDYIERSPWDGRLHDINEREVQDNKKSGRSHVVADGERPLS
jgi:hypothetical protein